MIIVDGPAKFMNSRTKTQVMNNTGALRGKRSSIYTGSSMGKMGVHRLSTYQWWKGVFDRILAFIAIVASSPLLAIIAIMIKLDSPGSAIFRREQVRENGRIFTAYKFRTMYTNNDDQVYKAYIAKYVLEDAPYAIDNNGQEVYKVVDDPRVTRFGALLRKTNLDELPQLFNVLKGEMSFVGPRPDIPFAVAMYKDWHMKRICIKPGITGLWQVYGRKELSFEDMVRLDIEYIGRQSMFLDAKILMLTVGTILKRDGS